MISLGQKYDTTAKPTNTPDSKASYPTFYFTSSEECDLPIEGFAKIKFRKIEDAENTRDPDDPKYRYELEVQGIEVIGGKSKSVDLGGMLKKNMREKVMAKKHEQEMGDE